MIKPGHYQNMSNEEYHSSHAISSSVLKKYTGRTAAHIEQDKINPKEETEAMLIGTLVHCLVLEPEKFNEEYAIRPENLEKPSSRILEAKKPSDESLLKISRWNKWLEELGDKKEITIAQYNKAEKMASSVLDHPIMGDWFHKDMDGKAEHSVFYWHKDEYISDQIEQEKYQLCRVRPDWILPGHPVIFDLKTCRDASFTGFMKQCNSLLYHMSAAMYIEGCNRCEDFKKNMGVLSFNKFVWVVVESEPPYLSTYYECSEQDLSIGKQIYYSLMRKHQIYQKSEWKGYGEYIDGFITPEGRLSQIPNYGLNIA